MVHWYRCTLHEDHKGPCLDKSEGGELFPVEDLTIKRRDRSFSEKVGAPRRKMENLNESL